jgi:peptidyl-tRNA hydrolase
MSANNSISQLLEQFIELYNNSLTTFEKTNEAITSDKESVVINLYDPANKAVKAVQVPSFGFLKREIERLGNNLDNLSSVGTASSTVKLKDGTYRKVFSSKLSGPAPKINTLYTPTTFDTKANQFFEDFLNPLLTVNLNVNGQIPANTEKVYVERYVFNSQNAASVQAFDTLYKSANTIDYTLFKNELVQNQYQYTLDSSIVEMPSRKVQYFGTFDVISVDNVQKTQIVDGVTQTNTVRLFTLNKFVYSDSSKALKETETLKVGDSLVVNTGKLATRYIVKSLNSSTYQIELELIEGFEGVNIGADELKIYKETEIQTSVELNVAFDERQVIFIKAIDVDSKIMAEEFSPGIAFYSNDLKLNMSDGSSVTLADYYKTEVADFGQFIKSLKNDFIPPATVGLVPNAPVLEVNNFKVVQVNSHLTDNDATNKITKLKSDKAASEQAIKKLDEAIGQKKTSIMTKKYTSTVEKDRDQNEYKALVDQRNTESSLYASLVSEIKAIADSNNLSTVAPKFKVRGFWSVPFAKKLADSVPQEVVQFKIRYRYVSTNGKTSQIEQIPFNDTNNATTKTAAFSNWIEVLGPVRTRVKDSNGKYYWQIENEEDAQVVNFNSLDIALQSGEAVEIMVKSLSEAGFPANPVESDWSNIAKIEFPEGQFTGTALTDTINQNSLEVIKVQVDQDLKTTGVYNHLDDSFIANSKYFAHNATTIASGFLTTEQNPVSLFDKLVEMQAQIQALQAQIAGTLGELAVYIEDQAGNQTIVNNHSVVKLFAGYYVDEITGQTDRKGAIVTKNFKLKLTNTKASELELVARLIGDREKPAYASGNSTVLGVSPSATPDAEVLANTYYTTEGKYDLVPILYQNIDATSIANNTFFNSIPLQSGQLRGQFIYSRFRNLANDADLYSMDAPDLTDVSGIDDFEYGLGYKFNNVIIDSNRVRNYDNATSVDFNTSSDSNAFIWSGAYNNATTPRLTELAIGSGDAVLTNEKYDNGIFLHKDHPLLKNGIITPQQIQGNGLVRMSKNSARRANMTDGALQNPYKLTTWINDGGVSKTQTLKMSFDANDQYLLGGHSCGAYLYLAPLEKTSLSVSADNKFGTKALKQGATNAISVDLIFQYRMTDYYGIADTGISTTSSVNETGRIGGIVGNTLSNITYSKKIGIDILEKNGDSFFFDVEVYAKYKQEGSSSTNVTSGMISNYNSTLPGGAHKRLFVDANDFSTPGEISQLR